MVADSKWPVYTIYSTIKPNFFFTVHKLYILPKIKKKSFLNIYEDINSFHGNNIYYIDVDCV